MLVSVIKTNNNNNNKRRKEYHRYYNNVKMSSQVKLYFLTFNGSRQFGLAN